MTAKSVFICQSCGAVLKKWLGQCPECKEWNTISQETEEGGFVSYGDILNKTNKDNGKVLQFERLDKKIEESPREIIGIDELDRVLGGGLVKGSAILIGGDPGIGKSTLLLQTLCSLANHNVNCMYISGEESTNQVRIRATRLGLQNAPIKLASATSVDDILKSIMVELPSIVVIDSIQTIFSPNVSSAPGTVSQVRVCANELVSLAKTKNITLFIVSHVNKDGQIAGPKVLEHMVDTVLYFEGDKDYRFRILRSIKNRFGAANEIGIFDMEDSGLIEIKNPSELFLSSRDDNVAGSVVFGGIEGTRPLLAEIQALIVPSYMPMPRRAVVGWDINRLAMIIAILSSRYGLNLLDKEVYLNVVGGLKINEPACDLAVALSLISTSKDKPIPKDCVVMGEIGLSGEIRMVSQIDLRLKEAEKLGFTKAIVPSEIYNVRKFKENKYKIKLYPIKHIRDVAKFINTQ